MNPARELHSLLSEWAVIPKGNGIIGVRTLIPPEDPEDGSLWQVYRATELFGEVKRSLELLEASGENVAAFRNFLQAWWEAVVMPNVQWNSGHTNQQTVISKDTLAALDAYAVFLEKTQLRPYPAQVEGFAKSRDAAETILNVIREQDDIEDDERTYVFQLLDEIRSLLDAQDLRVSSDLIRRVNELRGWLTAYEDYLESKEPGNPVVKKLKKAAKILLPPGKLFFGTAGYALGATANILAITQVGGN